MTALTIPEAASGILGSISLSCWLFVLVPQLIENIRLQSSDGLSKLFLALWLFGDITNLAGAIMAGLVPTAIWLAVYFTISDLVLLVQVIYYYWLNDRRRADSLLRRANKTVQGQDVLVDRTGLLMGESSTTNPVDYGTVSASRHSRRRSSLLDPILFPTFQPDSHRRRSESAVSSEARSTVGQNPDSECGREIANMWYNVGSVFAICLVGTVGWAIAYGSGVWKPVAAPQHQVDPSISPGRFTPAWDSESTQVTAQILGYTSAIAYLGARIPQIIKNQKERSVDGLSLLFFILSMMGNLTYGGGIMAHSLDRQYLITNLPWLLGSIGTMAEDAVIFVQFRVFGSANANQDDEQALID